MAVMIQHLASMLSAQPNDASALEAAISALRSSISALESSINTLDQSSGGWEVFGWSCSVAVAVGVILEIVSIVWIYREEREDWRRGVIKPPNHPPVSRLWFDIAATVLVVIGIFGEAVASAELASKNDLLRSKTNELRSKSDQLLALVTQVASVANERSGEANERASKNEEEAAQLRKDSAELEDSISWRRISPNKFPSMASHLRSHKSQVAWLLYNVNDVEANDFAVSIAAVLKLADWVPSEPESLLKMFEGPVTLGTNKLPRGVVISSTTDPASKEAAKELIEELLGAGFDATGSSDIPLGSSPTQAKGLDTMRGSAMSAGNLPTVFVSIEPRPDGPQGEAKLRAEAATSKMIIKNRRTPSLPGHGR